MVIDFAGAAPWWLAEEHEESRSCVLGIDIDCPASQGAKSQLGRPEAWPSIDAHTTRFEELCEHLGQQVGLAERLRCNHHGRGLLPSKWKARHLQCDADRDEQFHGSTLCLTAIGFRSAPVIRARARSSRT